MSTRIHYTTLECTITIEKERKDGKKKITFYDMTIHAYR